jgi:hypothetical protein
MKGKYRLTEAQLDDVRKTLNDLEALIGAHSENEEDTDGMSPAQLDGWPYEGWYGTALDTAYMRKHRPHLAGRTVMFQRDDGTDLPFFFLKITDEYRGLVDRRTCIEVGTRHGRERDVVPGLPSEQAALKARFEKGE